MKEYIRGTIIGGAVGDAFGMPYEGLSRDEVSQHYGSTINNFQDSVHSTRSKGLKKGQYTDDTQLTFATLNSIVEKKTVDVEDIGKRFVNMYKFKKLRAGGRSTKLALKNALKRGSAYQAGLKDAYGCGAAMRISPIGLLPDEGRAKELLVADVTYITHHNPVALASSMAMAYSINYLKGAKYPVEDGSQKLLFLDHVEQWSHYEAPDKFDFSAKVGKIKGDISSDFQELAERIGTSGLCTESVILGIVSFLKEPRDFDALMEQSVRSGGDTDSIASMAGTLFGAYNGLSAIPMRYKVNLEDYHKILSVTDRFADML